MRHVAWQAVRWTLRLAEGGAAAAGVVELLRRRERGVRILLYHHVGEEEGMVSPGAFQRHMEYLKRQYHPISLDLLAAAMSGRADLPPDPLIVTFDDGYEDTFQHAYPVLQRLAIPATVFVTTGFVGTPSLHRRDRLRRLLRQRDRVPAAVLEAVPGPARDNLLLLERLVDTRTCDALIAEMERAARLTSLKGAGSGNVSWEQVREMAASGIAVGAHTVTHPRLAELDPAALREEILGSKRAVEEQLGVPCRHFSYPYGGRSDVSAEAVRAVQEARFETACTTVAGVNGQGTDRYLLKRIGVAESWDTLARFALGLCGVDLERALDRQVQAVRRKRAGWGRDAR